jgi:hypothetical protein
MSGSRQRRGFGPRWAYSRGFGGVNKELGDGVELFYP